MKTFKISKKEYGNSYPFTVSPVTIFNRKGTKELYVVATDIWKLKKAYRYKLNGTARDGRDLSEIWLDNPDIPGTKKSIGFIFGLCKDRGF